MNVKKFVKAILKDVTEAVSESNNDKHRFYLNDKSDRGIDFDLAIVLRKGTAQIFATESEKVEGSSEVVNRIKFKVIAYKKVILTKK